MEFYPAKALDWNKYPFDEQTLVLRISEMSIPQDKLIINATRASFNHNKVNVGDMWKKESVTMEVVTVAGRQYLQITVKVSRVSGGKFYSLFMPAITVIFLDIAFHLLTSYDNEAGVFMTCAVVTGVGVNLINPDFLGIPRTLTYMPMMQCLMLMILIGGLKQMVLVLMRLIWLKRLQRVRARIADKKTKEEVSDVDEVREGKLSNQLAWFDFAIKNLVPVWYVLSYLIVVISYMA
jgi:hypothetical protein